MTIVLRISFQLTKKALFQRQNSKILPSIQCDNFQSLSIRSLSSHSLTKNLFLLSKEKKHDKIVKLKCTVPQDRPLVILLTWLMANKKHIYKYANFYTDKGFDVLNVTITPWQLLWPAKGSQVVAGDILKFLDVNRSYAPLVVHGFSVGGYIWGEVLVKIAQEQERYKNIIERTAGQVWDSAADITEIPVGFPTAVFPKNPVLQKTLRQYIIYHMKTFDKVATCHYLRASQMFHTNLIKAPTLIFVSKSDPIGAVSSNQRARESWEAMGMKVYWNCFEDSPHVGHMYKYPNEYLSSLSSFIDEIQLNVPLQAEAKI